MTEPYVNIPSALMKKIEQRHPYKFQRALPGAGVVIRVLKLHYHLRVVGIRVVGAHIFLSQSVLIEQRNHHTDACTACCHRGDRAD